RICIRYIWPHGGTILRAGPAAKLYGGHQLQPLIYFLFASGTAGSRYREHCVKRMLTFLARISYKKRLILHLSFLIRLSAFILSKAERTSTSSKPKIYIAAGRGRRSF